MLPIADMRLTPLFSNGRTFSPKIVWLLLCQLLLIAPCLQSQTIPATDVATALDAFKLKAVAKIDQDLEFTASAFAQARNIHVSARWSDWCSGPLDISRTVYDVLTAIDIKKPSSVQKWVLDAVKGADSYKKAYSFAIIGLDRFRQDGQNLQLAIDGPAYTDSVKAMLDRADKTWFISFDYDGYRSSILNDLNGITGSSPMVVVRKSATVDRTRGEVLQTIYAAKTYIYNQLKTLSAEMRQRQLSPDRINEITSFINARLQNLKECQAAPATISYSAYLQKGSSPVLCPVNTSLGTIAALYQWHGKMCGAYADNVSIELRLRLAETANTGLSLAVEGLTEMASFNLSVEATIAGQQEANQVLKNVVMLGFSTAKPDTGNLFNTSRTDVSNAREQVNMIPQQMMDALPGEVSKVLLLIDDTIQYVRTLSDATLSVPAPPLPTQDVSVPAPSVAVGGGEVMASEPISFKTYIFTPGKLTGQEFDLVKEKLHVRVFSFAQDRGFPKPKETVPLRFSLRGGYRAHDIFGHDDFEPKEAQDVATGWVPQANGNFIIFPDATKKHLPKWIAERTRMIRVPFVKQYGDTVVNAYDLALGLDRFNQGDEKSVSIDFKIFDATDDDGKKGKRLEPVSPQTDGVYYAYSLPDDRDNANYGFLFVVGTPSLGTANPTATQAPIAPPPVGAQAGLGQAASFLKFPIQGEFDPWDARITAMLDHDLKKDGKLKTFQGEGDNVKHVTVAENGNILSEGYDYFKKTDGGEFNLGDLSNYKESKARFFYDGHLGYDYSYEATRKVIAAADGELFVPGMEKYKAYHAIAIKHDNGFVTYYLHLSKWDSKIEEFYNNPAKQKARIKKGEVIGSPGGWGPKGSQQYGVHLHFGVHNGKDEIVDPYGEFKNGVQTAPVLWEASPIK